MNIRHTLATLSLTVGAAAAATAPASLDAMKWQRRIVLVSSPRVDDPKLALQRRIVREWQQGATDRDVSLVTVSAEHVDGVSDMAAALRKRYSFDASAFQALLIGKDGHVAMRSGEPISSDALQDAIDAMPMRKAGQR